MELSEIKEKLEEAVDTESWDIVIEVIGDIELEANYISPYDGNDEEDWG